MYLAFGEDAILLTTEFYKNDKLLQFWGQENAHLNKKTKTSKEATKHQSSKTTPYLTIPQGKKFSKFLNYFLYQYYEGSALKFLIDEKQMRIEIYEASIHSWDLVIKG